MADIPDYDPKGKVSLPSANNFNLTFNLSCLDFDYYISCIINKGMRKSPPHKHRFERLRIIFLSISLLIIAFQSQAQYFDKIDLGAGMGIDYGGFGTRLTYMPIERVGVFGSLGYNLNSLGCNLGAQFRIPVKKRFMGYLTAMYGYNAVLKVEGFVNESGYTYYGPSVGVGVQWKLSSRKNLWLNLEGILPFRPQSFSDAIHDLRSIGYEVQEPGDFGFSLGVHYRFKEKAKE